MSKKIRRYPNGNPIASIEEMRRYVDSLRLRLKFVIENPESSDNRESVDMRNRVNHEASELEDWEAEQ